MESDNSPLLPKGTIKKLVQEVIPENIKVADETLDLLLKCSIEFIHMLTSEANEICLQEKKQHLRTPHIIAALETLGFSEFIDSIKKVQGQYFSQEEQNKGSKRKLESLGIPHDELLAKQQELFAKARANMENSQLDNKSQEEQASK